MMTACPLIDFERPQPPNLRDSDPGRYNCGRGRPDV